MAKTKIEWAHYTINPISGCNGAICEDGIRRQCPYCYAKSTAENERMSRAFPDKFEIVYHPERLKQFAAIKKPSLIFIDSMSDLFGGGVRPGWVQEIFAAMAKSSHHIYLILTKSPERIPELVTGDMYRPNIWIGVSVDTVLGCRRIAVLQKIPEFKKFISFEPLLEEMPIDLDLHDLSWMIVGQRTKPFNNPPENWILSLLYQSVVDEDTAIPYFIKNNLLDRGYLVSKRKSDFQNFPKEMHKIKECELS
jgi:protein gp37